MVYLLHSTVALQRRGVAGVRHYLGYTDGKADGTRINQHIRGGSRVPIVNAFKAAGGKIILARTWPDGTYADERRMKNRGHFDLWCPICKAENA